MPKPKPTAEPDPDPSEVSDDVDSRPELDSPGGEGQLQQEEAYEGISSDTLPSEKTGKKPN